MRAFKTVNDSYVEPISFIVPRRAEVFQDDIFPPVVGSKPAMSAESWLQGKEELPPKIDLASVYAGEEPKEVEPDHKPSTQALAANMPLPTKKEPEPESKAAPSAIRGPPPSMNQQTDSIKDLATKFTDDNEAEDGDDSSSFEEVAKPVDRSEKAHTVTAPSEKSGPATTSRGFGGALSPVDKPDDFDKASQMAANQSTEKQIRTQQEPLGTSKTEPVPEQLPSSAKTQSQNQSQSQSQSGSEVQSSLAEIKSLLVQQSKTMSTQNDTISKLTAEVDRLRSKIGES